MNLVYRPVFYHSPLPPQPLTGSLYDLVMDLTRTKDQEFLCETEGVFPNIADCSKYFVCDKEGDKGKEFDCLFPLTGLLFSPSSSSCQYAAKVVCAGDQLEEDSEFEAVEAEYEVEFDCEAEGSFPDQEYCMRYIKCSPQLQVK